MVNNNANSNSDEQPRLPKFNRGFLWYYFLVLIGVFALNLFVLPLIQGKQIQPTTYSTFLKMLENDEIKAVSFREDKIVFIDFEKDGVQKIYKTGIMNDPNIVERLQEKGVEYSAEIPEKPNMFLSFLMTWGIPILFFFLIQRAMSKRVQGMGGLFQNNKIKKYEATKESATFKDVAGQEEAVESLKEIVDYLKNPEKSWKI
ncbi:MAG: hypothetical protein GX220_01530 [Treponema sp.]|nr:hypothetical protein [Treponema sp.]